MRFPLRFSPPWRVLLTVLGMPPSKCFADIDVDRGTLHVRGGIWFDESLPLAEIVSVERSSWPWYGGLGVKLGPTADAVTVVTSLEGLVAIRFSQPQPMSVVFKVKRPELRVSVEDPEGFMVALRRAIGRTAQAA